MDTRVTNTVVDGGVGEGDAAGRRLGAVRDGRHGEGGLVQDAVAKDDSGELDLVAGLAHVAEVAEEDGDGVGGRDHGAVQGVGLIGSDAGVDARRRS